MHEGPFNKHEAEGPPIYVINGEHDGGIREDWLDAAEYIAHMECGIAFARRREEPCIESMLRRRRDGLEPAFLMVGKRVSLDAVGETVTGTIEHGQTFLAWAKLVGDNPEALRLFDEAFLGSFESAAEFAGQVMGELGPLSADASEEDHQMQMLFLANELADELQRRGVICAIPNPTAGVWVFRTTHPNTIAATAQEQRGGEDA